jgi:DNA ligase 1
MKPMLASNYDEKKLRFPLLAQPKIDGVRGWNPNGILLGRSLKPLKNSYTTRFFSQPEYAGLDGELAAADERDPMLCTKTTSATSTILGQPFLLWHCFDYVTEHTSALPYSERYKRLLDVVNRLGGHLRCIPSRHCANLEQLLEYDEEWLNAGYEGTIIRDPMGMHKQGRSTVREGGLLRIKRFTEEEATVVGITEGNRNDNEALVNELGRTYRTSHQENKVPNGEVGNLQCTILKDSDLFKAGDLITVSPGNMTQAECKYYFEHPQAIIGQIIKFKYFAKGVKDKPRFPTFVCIRSLEDIGTE